MKFAIEFKIETKEDADQLCEMLEVLEREAMDCGGYGAEIAHRVVDLRYELRSAIPDLPSDEDHQTKKASPA